MTLGNVIRVRYLIDVGQSFSPLLQKILFLILFSWHVIEMLV